MVIDSLVWTSPPVVLRYGSWSWVTFKVLVADLVIKSTFSQVSLNWYWPMVVMAGRVWAPEVALAVFQAASRVAEGVGPPAGTLGAQLVQRPHGDGTRHAQGVGGHDSPPSGS